MTRILRISCLAAAVHCALAQLTPQQLEQQQPGQQRAEQDRSAQAQAEQLRASQQFADRRHQAQEQREVQTSAEQQRRIEIQAERRAEEQQREELLAQQAEAGKQSQIQNQEADPRVPRTPQPEASPPPRQVETAAQPSAPNPTPAFSMSLLARSLGIGVLAGTLAVALGKTVQRLFTRSRA